MSGKMTHTVARLWSLVCLNFLYFFLKKNAGFLGAANVARQCTSCSRMVKRPCGCETAVRFPTHIRSYVVPLF